MSRIPRGLQLYFGRDDAARDLPHVLEAVAKIGYGGTMIPGYVPSDNATPRK